MGSTSVESGSTILSPLTLFLTAASFLEAAGYRACASRRACSLRSFLVRKSGAHAASDSRSIRSVRASQDDSWAQSHSSSRAFPAQFSHAVTGCLATYIGCWSGSRSTRRFAAPDPNRSRSQEAELSKSTIEETLMPQIPHRATLHGLRNG